MAGNTHSVEDVIEAIRTGTMQTIFNENGVIITQILDYPRKRVMDVFMCVGELDAIKALEGELIAHAKKNKAHFGRAFVRPGLVEHWTKMGWRKGATVMTYGLEN